MTKPLSHLFFLLLLFPCTFPHPCNFPRQFFSNECILSKRTQQFWCISAETDKAISCPSTCSTVGGNDPGQGCVFPFIFEGKNRSACIPSSRPGDQDPFCATTANFDKDGRWTFCRNSCCDSQVMCSIVVSETVIVVICVVLLLLLRLRLLRLNLRIKSKSMSRSMSTCAGSDRVHLEPLLKRDDSKPEKFNTSLQRQSSAIPSEASNSLVIPVSCPTSRQDSISSQLTSTTQLSSIYLSDRKGRTFQEEQNSCGDVRGVLPSEDGEPRSEKCYETQKSTEPLLENDELEKSF